jgi:hypothetical protein
MKHLYKVGLQLSDMFISELDIEKSMIRYTIRDKISGQLIEPEHYVPFTVNENEQKVEFNGGRYIAIGLAALINQVLS